MPSEFSVEHDGDTIEFSKFISKDSAQVSAIVVEPGDFPACPICLERDPEAAEHVPPQSLGGRIMTSTCLRCNHDFGTAEEELRRFLEMEVEVQAESSDGQVKGRRAATVALRSTEGRPPGAFVRTSAPEFNDVLNSGSSQLTITPIDMPLLLTAALKHAYLAACLHQREVPTSDDVTRVRAVLLAARDRDRDALIAALPKVTFLAAPGWIEAADAPSVLLLEAPEDEPHWQFAFAGRFILPWPFPDVLPRAAR